MSARRSPRKFALTALALACFVATPPAFAIRNHRERREHISMKIAEVAYENREQIEAQLSAVERENRLRCSRLLGKSKFITSLFLGSTDRVRLTYFCSEDRQVSITFDTDARGSRFRSLRIERARTRP